MNVVVFFVLLALAAVVRADFCDDLPPNKVEKCVDQRPRDVIFMLDGSNSMDRDRFYAELLDFTQLAICAFDKNAGNQFGMVIFKKDVKAVIPLGQYGVDEWVALVEGIRAKSTSCCSCCTDHALSFDVAKEQFQKFGLNPEKVAMSITDGTPYQGSTGPYRYPQKMNQAKYNYVQVPKSAQNLKDLSRLLLIGVPRADGRLPDRDYFEGIPDPTKAPATEPFKQCDTRNGKKTCGTMELPPFPIVSEPPEKNSFETTSWDIDELLGNAIDALCEILPTEQPTAAPTSGSLSPTVSPTLAPTLEPTTSPTEEPTPRPTRPPTKRPTRPTPEPTYAPVVLDLDHLDLHIVLDHSKSMRDHHNLCMEILKEDTTSSFPDVVGRTACWNLFLDFAKRLSEEIAQIDSIGGWSQGRATRGLRVSLYGFACSNKQSKPIADTYLLHAGSSSTVFNELDKMRTDVYPDGGTCPNKVLYDVVDQMTSEHSKRPYQAVVTITDGVFYDMPWPKKAARGFRYYGAQSYALGIAIPKNGNKFGLTNNEIERQRKQLRNVASKKANVFNLGNQGFALLDDLAKKIANQLPGDFYKTGRPSLSEEWCQWPTEEKCLEYSDCKFINGRCRKKSACDYKNRDTCERDSYCRWRPRTAFKKAKCKYDDRRL